MLNGYNGIYPFSVLKRLQLETTEFAASVFTKVPIILQ